VRRRQLLVPPRVEVQRHRPHPRPEGEEAEVQDEAAEAADKQIEEEEVTEAAPQPGALGRFLKETPKA
jgi:hypothetical protein